MRFVKEGLLASIVAGVLIAQVAGAQRTPDTPRPNTMQRQTTTMPARPSANAQAVLDDVEKTLGFVPQFFRAVSDVHLASFWGSIKDVQIAETSLDNKTKELIGLAVASQIPCDYCIVFHSEVARKNGATEQQIREAISMASVTRMASTVLNGSRVDEAQFRKDLQRLIKGTNGKKQSTAASR